MLTRNSLQKLTPIRGRKHFLQLFKYRFQAFCLQKLTPIRGRKPLSAISILLSSSSLQKLTPIGGRKLIQKVNSCYLYCVYKSYPRLGDGNDIAEMKRFLNVLGFQKLPPFRKHPLSYLKNWILKKDVTLPFSVTSFLYKNKPNLEKFGCFCNMGIQTHILLHKL